MTLEGFPGTVATTASPGCGSIVISFLFCCSLPGRIAPNPRKMGLLVQIPLFFYCY